MAITQVYVDPAIAGNSGTGTIGDPYGDLQYALDTQARDATNGDQFNVKAGTAEVLAAALTLATYGTPTEAAGLVIRGYTAAANDGGQAEINANGVSLFASTTLDYVYLIDLYCHDFGDNNAILLRNNCLVYRCSVTRGASTPSLKSMISVGDRSVVAGCYVYGGGTNVWGIMTAGACLIYGNYVTGFTYVGIKANSDSAVIQNNVVVMSGTGSFGIRTSSTGGLYVLGNTVYSPAAATTFGIWLGESAGQLVLVCKNNIVVGISGVGGIGIGSALATRAIQAGYNAYYNCTANYSMAQTFIDETAHDVVLAADPFVDAANGDFSLTAAAKTALRGVGWPAAYLGAHANTDGHITIGAIQYGEAEAGGGVQRRVARILGG